MSDRHWLDETDDVHATTRGDRHDASPPTPLGVVAGRIADVSPAWAAVTLAPRAVPATADLAALSRDRAQGVEAIREGWLLHRAASRVAAAASPDLALLVGDWCYAAGLCTISDHGTLDDVEQLARLVADVSARRAEPIEALDARWTETTEALRHG